MKSSISFSIADIPVNISIQELFSVAQEEGVSGVEILPGFKTFPHMKKLQFLTSKYNIPILSIHQPLLHGLGSIGQEASLQLASAFHALYTIHPLSSVATSSSKAEEYFTLWKNQSRKYHVPILLENMPKSYTLPLIRNIRKPHSSTSDLSTIQSICKKYDFGMTLDTTHLMKKHPEKELLSLPWKSSIKNIHLSDFSGSTQHMALGKGEQDTKSFLRFLRENHYKGIITLELSPKVFVNKKTYIEDLRQSVKFVRTHIHGI